MSRNVREGRASIGQMQFALLLQSVPYLGEKTLTRLLRYNALNRVTPEACLALSAEEWHKLYAPDPRAIAELSDHQERLLAGSAELARVARAHDVQILTCDSMTYPARIERFDDAPPPILTALGRTALLDEARFTFTLVCSNGASAGSLATLDRLSTELAASGGVPVAGHDRPAYQRLALGAQRQGKPVSYVFDRGLREALGPEFDRPPFAAARIRDLVFDSHRDLALSPFRLDDHCLGANNRRRDRLVFALADLIVAVDVSAGGTMEALCRRAHEQRKPVLVASGGRSGNALLLEVGCHPLPTDGDWIDSVLEGARNGERR